MKKSETVQIGILLAITALFLCFLVGRRMFFSSEIVINNVTATNIVVAEQYIENKININTADLETLKELNGIGDVIAGRIIDYRTSTGSFSSIYDLLNINGISENLFLKLKSYITV